MKKIFLFGMLLLTSILFSNCTSEEKKDTDQHNKDIAPLSPKEIRAVCTESESPNPDVGPPILTKTCLYKNFKLVSTGYPDYKGRYSYEFAVFIKQSDNSFVPSENDSFFNTKKDELIVLINSKIKEDYDAFLNDPESRDCFTDYTYRAYSLNELGMTIDEEGFHFNVNFGLSGACMAVDGTTISLSWEEMDKYL